MTREIKQEQGSTPAKQSAVPTGTIQPSQDRAGRKKAIVELADADLKTVSGGGGMPGGVVNDKR